MLNLGFNLEFADLYGREGLHRVDAAFLSELDAADPALHLRLSKARLDAAALDAKQQSQLLIDLAPHVDDFVGTLFGIRAQLGALAEQHHQLAPLYEAKRQFVQRRAAKAYAEDSAGSLAGELLCEELANRIGAAPAQGAACRLYRCCAVRNTV